MKDLEQERDGLAAVVRRMNDKNTYEFLSDEGLLPNYAFPEAGVNLKAILTRKVTTEDENGEGILIEAMDRPFGFNAGYYTPEKIDSARHLFELEKDNYITVCLDAAERGVGGDMPGAAYLHKPYKLNSGEMHKFEFRISKV